MCVMIQQVLSFQSTSGRPPSAAASARLIAGQMGSFDLRLLRAHWLHRCGCTPALHAGECTLTKCRGHVIFAAAAARVDRCVFFSYAESAFLTSPGAVNQMGMYIAGVAAAYLFCGNKRRRRTPQAQNCVKFQYCHRWRDLLFWPCFPSR